MVIECVNCGVKYKIDDSRLDSPRKKVKCSKCGEVFTVSKNAEQPDSSISEQTAVDSSRLSREQTESTPDNQSQVHNQFEAEKHLESNFQEDLRSEFSPPANGGARHDQTDVTFDTENTKEAAEQRDDFGSEAEEPQTEEDLFKSPFDPENISMSDDSDLFESKKDYSFDENHDKSPEEKSEPGQTATRITADDEKSEMETVELIDWESLEVDEIQKKSETESSPVATESMKEEKSDDSLELEGSREYKTQGFKKETEVTKEPDRAAPLTPDFSDVLSDFSRVSAGSPPPGSESDNPYVKSSKKKKGFVSRVVMSLLYLVVLTIVFTAVIFSLVTFDVIPQESFEKYAGYVSSYVSALDKEQDKKTDLLSIRDLKGKWINTRNGYMYVVYGRVLNEAKIPVNYIKLRSTFRSAGSELYQQEFYSGNTLTLKEFKNSSPAVLREKLNRREGDVDLQDVDTFAGRNYDIQPGEKVPFYTFYLSGKKLLGLKYDIEIMDFATGND